MAQMFPTRFPDSDPPSERIVFDALAGTDDEFLVFHSVPWQGIRHGKQGDGEADFLIAHPNKGVLILEVKGGTIHIDEGHWVSEARNGERHEIRNPFEQASDSKFRLREFLEDIIPRLPNGRLRVGHAVAFPSIEVHGDLSTDGPRGIILDRYDVQKMRETLDKTMAYWDKPTRLDEQQFSLLRKALAPTTKIAPQIRHHVEDVVDKLIELTEQQAQLLLFLRRQRRALISGGAGTGKTVLAIERARQLAAEGRSVLLLCFNAPLGDSLATQLADLENVTAGNFHKLAMNMVSAADMTPAEWDDDFWDVQLPNLLPDAAEKLGMKFDAIIIDEGQDFHEHWWTALELLLEDPESGFMYVFADEHQDLYQRGWSPPFEADPFVLNVNCRNTKQIAARVNAVFDREESSLGIDGPKPKLKVAEGETASTEILQFLSAMLNNGMNPEQLTVLAQKKRAVIGLRGKVVEGHKLVEPGKEGIVVETIHRFKGLESDAVVLWLEELDDTNDLILAYVGMSRARALLFVIGPDNVRAQLDWQL